MKITIITALVLCASLTAMHSNSVRADQAWQPILDEIPKQQGYRRPTDYFRFPIPAGLSVDYLQQVTLELDDVDVTALIRREGNYAIYTPPEPLQYGNHSMRIVHYAPNGDIEELANWDFEVRQSRYYRQASLQGNSNIGFTHKVSDHNIVAHTSDNSTNGAANVTGAIADEKWQITGQVDLIGNSNYKALNLPRDVDVGNFLFTGKSDNVTVNAGHQTIGGSSLILDTLNNRGVSATLNNTSQTYSASAFAMRATPVNGFEHGLGVTDSENRIDGAFVNAFPLTDHPEQQFLSLIYLNGKSSTGVVGTAVSGDTYAREGNAWELLSESRFHQQQMRVRLEYAQADLTAIDSLAEVAIPTLNDTAYAVLAEYQPQVNNAISSPAMWKIGLLHQYIGRDFSSIGNVALPRDKQLLQLSGDYSRGVFSSNAAVSSETNNVKKETYIPQVRTNRVNCTMQYSPQLKIQPDGQPEYGVLGQQSYLVSFNSAQSKDVESPDTSVFAATDLDTRAVNLTGSFNYQNWNWSISHAIGSMTDHTEAQPYTETTGNTLSGSWRIGANFALVPSWQFNSNKIGSMENKTDIVSVDTTLQLWNSKLAMHLGYSHTYSRTSDGSQDTVTDMYQPSIDWRVVTGNVNKPDATLRLAGIYTGVTDNVVASNTNDSYQIMLTAIIGLQFGL